MTTSYTRDQLNSLEGAMFDVAPELPSAGDLEHAFSAPGVTMAGSPAGVVLNVGIDYNQYPVFLFLNCLVARELFALIYDAALDEWPHEEVAFQRDASLLSPLADTPYSAVDVASLRSTVTPDGMLINMCTRSGRLVVFISRAIAMEILFGIRTAAERSDWWDENYNLLPDVSTYHAANQETWELAN